MVGGAETQLQIPTQPLITLEGEDRYEQFGQTVHINSIRKEYNAELLPPPTLVSRLVHSVNIATNNTKGDGLTGWDDRSISSVVSARDKSIMAMASSGKNNRSD